MEIKFIDYVPTPSDKQLGIAKVLIGKTIYLKYKVLQGRHGGGYAVPASLKVGNEYTAAYVFESNEVKESVEKCLKSNINRILAADAPRQDNFMQTVLPIDQDIGECPF